ncbi:MAG: hypothetical protein J5486_08580 [Bacteroidaceae bacterium]|nr:hypothetical protein [Bacteroidaceae bacterium]
MKKLSFYAILMALAFVVLSCGADNKSKGSSSSDADEEMVDDEEDAEATDEDEEADAEVNSDLLGNWSNNQDPNVEMHLYAKRGQYDDIYGFGYLKTYNEFFEPEYTYVFAGLEADGDNISVTYDKREMQLTGGDPDNYDSEEAATWEEVTVATGSFTISPDGTRKCSIASGDKRINHMKLFKQE